MRIRSAASGYDVLLVIRRRESAFDTGAITSRVLQVDEELTTAALAGLATFGGRSSLKVVSDRESCIV